MLLQLFKLALVTSAYSDRMRAQLPLSAMALLLLLLLLPPSVPALKLKLKDKRNCLL